MFKLYRFDYGSLQEKINLREKLKSNLSVTNVAFLRGELKVTELFIGLLRKIRGNRKFNNLLEYTFLCILTKQRVIPNNTVFV